MLRTDQPDCAWEGGEEGVGFPTPLPPLARPTLDEVLALLEAYHPQAKDTDSLEKLITYLSDRRAYLPNYKQRCAQRQHIGSAHAEKAHDLLVARRRSIRACIGVKPKVDGLAALRTLLLNGGWDLY